MSALSDPLTSLLMRRNPAACSKVFSPSLGTLSKPFLFGKGPFLSRKSTMFFARMLFRPDTRANSGTEAVFKSTPTALTQSSTVRVDGITIQWHEQGLNNLLRDTLAPEGQLEAA